MITNIKKYVFLHQHRRHVNTNIETNPALTPNLTLKGGSWRVINGDTAFSRVKLTVNPNAPEFVTKRYLTHLLVLGFKDQEGNWFVCLRMNVDQYSPKKCDQ